MTRSRAARAPEQVAFKLVSKFPPAGDQPQAIQALEENLRHGQRFQTLLGVTGSGKTYTMANVIARMNKPTLVIAPNKTLAAQLYAEFKEFFPENRVGYFVSYYDYYQPEAYVPSSDTYIEKDSAINEEIDKMRHGATKALIEATDVIIVASVSCIYGLGAPEDYLAQVLFVEKGETTTREQVIRRLVEIQYSRNDVEFARGNFRVRGDVVDVFPSDENAVAVRLMFLGNTVDELREIDAITGVTIRKVERIAVYPTSHFVTGRDSTKRAERTIKAELEQRLVELRAEGKLLEAQRLEQRTLYDLELLAEVGFCPGVENYSRHMSGRTPGEPPGTLIDYFPEGFLLILDESHVTLPQLGGMYRGDRARKETLVNFGFRLPSALDNRPLNLEEFWKRVGQTVFVSATPAEIELEMSGGNIIEQVNRPTGLLDPQIDVRPATNQIDDLLQEIRKTVAKGDRVLVTTLTKKMSEDLAEYLREIGIKCRYLHSDINALDRVEILRGLRRGDFDVLIGINLLREGLDLVEVSLVAILDADKEGFLRSARSLIQTMGRAARNIDGRVILYADSITGSMKEAMAETERRRKIQAAFNEAHSIVPKSARSAIQGSLAGNYESEELEQFASLKDLKIPKDPKAQQRLVEKMKKQMFEAAAKREFEKAALIRDQINLIQNELLKV